MIHLEPIASLTPAAYNPRNSDRHRMELVKLSIIKLGFLLPVYATTRGEIVSGHQRQIVAKELGLTHLPVQFVKPMKLRHLKAINITFNRATNDMRAWDTPAAMTDALDAAGVRLLADEMPDLPTTTPAIFPCLDAKRERIKPLLAANKGRWVQYAANTSRLLLRRGIDMPIIVASDGTAINGVGRLQALAESKKATALVVRITDGAKVELARSMLNLLSMDFDIHTRYANELRYNSFRRPHHKRNWLGHAFTFDLSAEAIDITDAADRGRWVEHYGRHVLDFGAGLLDETRLLTGAGVDCTAFEPYLLDADRKIDRRGATQLARKFLDVVARGQRFDSVFLSAVLNSVPFVADRRHILTLLAALATERTTVYACSSSTAQAGYQFVSGAEFVNHRDKKRLQFQLNYEPRTTLADIGSTPKVQKYHTETEFGDLFRERFESVTSSQSCNNVEAVCRKVKAVSRGDLEAACRFEFDLPYPDGERMGLVSDAIAAFKARRGKL